MVPRFNEMPLSHLRWLSSEIDSVHKGSSFEDVFNLVINLMQGYVVPYLLFESKEQSFNIENPEHAYGIFRVRVIDSITDVQQQKALWGLPKDEVKNYGRCHSPNRSVLYCANSLAVALVETNVKIGNYITISRFETRSPLLMGLAGEKRKKVVNDPVINASGNSASNPALSKKTIEKMHFIEKCLVKWFRTKVSNETKHRYLITSAVCKFLNEADGNYLGFEKQNALDGLIYPSVKNDGLSFNFAFDSDKAAKKLQIETIYLARVEKVTSANVSVQLLASVNELVDDENMIWETIGRAKATDADLIFLNQG